MKLKEYLDKIDNRINKLNFINDNRNYYVYRVTDINTKEYYYGSRIQIKDDITEDFWYYCTSSKRKNLILENKENYKVKIIKSFNNAGDMIIYESFLHQYFNVKNNSRFWNRSNQTPYGFTTAGIKSSEETKKKISKNTFRQKESYRNNMSKAKLGTVMSENMKTLTSIRMKENNPMDVKEYRDKISKANMGSKNGMFGKSHSEKTKEKMRKPKGPQVRLTCPHCKKEGGASNMKRYHLENCKLKGK